MAVIAPRLNEPDVPDPTPADQCGVAVITTASFGLAPFRLRALIVSRIVTK